MTKVLVTGGTGFIGKYVVDQLLKEGYEVIVSTTNPEYKDSRVTVATVPIFSDEPDLYEKLGSPDICIHLAWKNGFNHNHESHMGDLSRHVRFCQKMMGSGLKILSCIGTMHEVGYWEGAIGEDTPCNPQSQYGIAKNAMRQSLMLAARNYGCAFNWLRGYYIESNDQRAQSIFSKIAAAESKGQEKFPFVSGKNQYDFLPVERFAELVVRAAVQDKVTGIIEVCSGCPESIGSRIENYIAKNGYKIKLAYGEFPDRPYDSPGVWGDPEKINRILEQSEQ